MQHWKSMKKWFLHNRRIIFFVLVVFVVWQALVVAVVNLGSRFIPSTLHYTYTDPVGFKNPQFLWERANFDGIHYLEIARKGYGIYQQAFFPLYPNLIKWLTPYFFDRDLIAGLAISWLSFLLAIFFFYKLVLLDFKDRIARRAVLLLLCFPSAFFFSTLYSESLFLLLILGSFYFARQEKWWVAGILGALASGTRVVGVLLLPALLFEWYEQKRERGLTVTQSLLRLVPIGLIPVGLLSYMRFLAINYNDPLMFIHVQSSFGAGRTGGSIILLYQVFWRYFKMLATTRIDPLYFTVWLEFITASLFLFLLIFAFYKKIRLSYLLFAGLAYVLPTLTGTFSSMQRGVLILFPCFVAFALVEKPVFRYFWWGIGFLLLIVSTIFFTHGYWIG